MNGKINNVANRLFGRHAADTMRWPRGHGVGVAGVGVALLLAVAL